MWESRKEDPQNLAQLAAFMDTTYDRNFPVSSLTISRFVDSISSREEVEQAEYYLYKFRHSPNCWYLRDWTVHSWIRQCLKYGAKDKALHTLKNKVQYGIFPDEFTFNLLLDSYIKEDNFKGACSIVEEVMLQESFDLPSTQILSLYALSRYLATKPKLSLSEEKFLGASLLIAGLKQDNTVGHSAQLFGTALLGKVEMSEGIHAVFRGMPLMWTPGYVGRALAVMEAVAASPGDVKLTKDSIDCLEAVLQELSSASASDSDSSEGEESGGEEDKKEKKVMDEEDLAERAKLPEYASRFQELSSQLQSQARVEADSLEALVSALAQQNLAQAEEPDLEQYRTRVKDWESERRQLIQREAESREVAEKAKQARLAARAAAQQP